MSKFGNSATAASRGQDFETAGNVFGPSALFSESAETCRRRPKEVSGSLKAVSETVEGRKSDVLAVFQKSLFDALLQTMILPTSDYESDLVGAAKSVDFSKTSRTSLLRPSTVSLASIRPPGSFAGPSTARSSTFMKKCWKCLK